MKSSLTEDLKEIIKSDSLVVSTTKAVLLAVAFYSSLSSPRAYEMIRAIVKGRKFDKRQIQQAVYVLKRQKLIRIIEEKDGVSRVELTIDGVRKVKKFSIDHLKIEVPRRWDGKWRILIFDIPTDKKYNNAREAMRRKIKELDFYQLQKSVWVHPFPCEEELLFVAENFKVERYIEIIIAEKLLHENIVKQKFTKLLK